MGVIKNYFREKKARKVVLNYDDETLDIKVKIQGTSFDRKRKLTDKQVKKLIKDISDGMSIEEVALKYRVSEWVVKYNSNPDFKKHQLDLRKGKSKAHDNYMDFEDRVNYKRLLIKEKKIKVAGMV